MAERGNVCLQCSCEFQARTQSRRYKKRRLDSKIRGTEISVLSALQDVNSYQGVEQGHICEDCLLDLERQCQNKKRQAKGKLSAQTKTTKTTKTPKKGNLAAISRALAASKYHRALRHIIARSSLAKKAFQDIVEERVRCEVNQYVRHNTYPILDGTTSIQDFSWLKLFNDIDAKAPTLTAAVKGAMPSEKKMSAKQRSTAQPRMGFMLTIPLYHRNPSQFKFIQALCGIQLWRCGGSEKVFRCFNQLGLCQSMPTTRRNVDTLCLESDKELLKWKADLELISKKKHDEVGTVQVPNNGWVDVGDDANDPDYHPSEGSDSSSNEDEAEHPMPEISCEGSTVQKQSNEPGFALVWDNTQKQLVVRDQAKGRSNKMLLWANAYAAQNRVVWNGPDVPHCLRAADVPYAAFLPQMEDRDMLRHRMAVIVSRILVQHIPHFSKHYKDAVMWHIPHQFSKESAQKSKTVNIGIIEENPSTTAGTIKIMEVLQDYVPRSLDGSFRQVPTHGDGGSVERMTDGQRARSADHSDTDRLEGLVPIPQEMHHRGLLNQDYMNNHFDGKSLTERGTSGHLKTEYNHKSVCPKDVMNSLNFADNFMRFTTEAHVVYLALHLCGMASIDDIPENSVPSASAPERQSILMHIAERIVDEVWLMATPEQISEVLEAEIPNLKEFEWCFCREDREDSMVRCSNQECPLGTWFHNKCVGLKGKDVPAPDEDWWCSAECRATGLSILCRCKQQIIEGPLTEMISCSGANCNQGSKFHLCCVSLEEVPDGDWYCSRKCADDAGLEQDYKRNYAISLTWSGLLDLCHRDMIREADGLAMIAMWRINMLQFWRGSHYKYMILAHRLLAGVSGWLSPRLIHEVVHNRTVNLRSGLGNNIAMDRVCEFINAQFKETLQHAHGNCTSATIQRAGKMVGSQARALDEAFHLQVSEVAEDTSYRKKHNYQDDIEAFVKDFQEDRLFHHIPGRQHDSFPKFQCDPSILNPEKLKARFVRYSKKLDMSRSVLLQ